MMNKIALTAPGGYRFSEFKDQPVGGMNSLQSIIQNSLTILLIIAILLTLFFLIWGGIEWVTSGGNKEKIQTAQKKIIFAVIGLVIALGAFMIINIVGELFGVAFFGA